MQARIIASNTFFQILGKVVSSGIGLLLTYLIAKSYGTIGYGIFTQVTTYIGFLYLVIDFGMNALYVKANAEEISFPTLITTRFLIATGLFTLVSIFGLLLLPLSIISPIFFLSILCYGTTLFTQAILFSAMAKMQKTLSYRSLFYASSVGSLFSLFCVWISLLFSLPLFFIFISYAAGSLVAGVCALWLVKEQLTLHVKQDAISGLLKASLPLGLMLLCNVIYFRIDVLLLSLFRSTAEVGIYGYAYRFFDVLLTLPLFLANAIYPFLLQNKKNFRNSRSLQPQYLLLFIVFSLVVTLVSWILAGLIGLINIEFLHAVALLRILIFSLPFFFITSFMQWLLIAYDKQKSLFLIYLFGALCNIIGNLLLIPLYGAVGAAIMTGVSEGIILSLLFLLFFFF